MFAARKNALDELRARLKTPNCHIDIPISDSDIEYINHFVEDMVEAKMKEKHRIVDKESMHTREFTGKVGELAIERWLLTPFLDISIGESKDYDIPDLRSAGYEMGCKTVTYKNIAPLVPKQPKNPELICLWDEKLKVVHILGIASVKVLKEFSEIDLVISEDVKRANKKTGFGKFSKLLPPSEFWMNQYKTK